MAYWNTDEITNTADILDGRDVIARRDELAEEREWLAEAVDEAREAVAAVAMFDPAEYLHAGQWQEARDNAQADYAEACAELAEWEAGSAEELAKLEAFIKEGSDDWRHGETLVRESYFTEYAQQLAEEIEAIPDNARWPCTCIDWEQAAKELKQDYTGADFDGVTYYFRG